MQPIMFMSMYSPCMYVFLNLNIVWFCVCVLFFSFSYLYEKWTRVECNLFNLVLAIKSLFKLKLNTQKV